MTAYGKYRVIEADTLESSKFHRAQLEQALLDTTLSPELYADLIEKLRRTIILEQILQTAADEQEARKKEGAGESKGGQGGSGKSGSGDKGVKKTKNEDNMDETSDGLVEDAVDIDRFALLFFLVEEDIAQPRISDMDASAMSAAAAATVLFRPDDHVAQLHGDFVEEHEGAMNAMGDVLPALERHAVTIGAQIMQLKVAPGIVDAFAQKFGYQAYGRVFNRNGRPMQQVRKVLKPFTAVQPP